MTAAQYTHKLEKANPRLFAAQKIQLRPEVLIGLLRDAFDAGQQSMKQPPPLFEQFFGKLKR